VPQLEADHGSMAVFWSWYEKAMKEQQRPDDLNQ
jgi:hypothetical protein